MEQDALGGISDRPSRQMGQPHPLPVNPSTHKRNGELRSYNIVTKALSRTSVPEPFFATLPSEIHSSMYPDVLHQLLQGVLKHLISWLKQILGQKELDRCFQCQPHAHGIQHYKDGFPDFSRLTGKEVKDIFRVFPGAICASDALRSKGEDGLSVMKATVAMTDFYYFATFPVHSDHTLPLMRQALLLFHKNKNGFLNLGVRCDKGITEDGNQNPFCIPKLHFLTHYIWAIVEAGALPGFDTQMSERLHIAWAKNPFRSTSRRRETSTNEMALWVERQEAMQAFQSLVQWRRGTIPLSKLRTDQGF
ncbi:hypothetical protein CALCODRAFT_466994 [Calocera cornea HHB12733]|uniref:Uncharacterized protein n=1 Tax=Calocera cornea HHB12733 TaxID=1353952 RepID=A0A165HJ23_9BASI|nr:hypothetical protein CALCODRAFT_466994 [Calocera cornea HHB12733]